MLFRLCDFSQFFFMSPKIPPFIFLVFCNRTNVKKSQRVPSFRFFGTMRMLKILIFLFFFENFSSLAPIFRNFATEWMLKNLKVPPFTVFGIVRFFNRIIFVLKLAFLRPSTLYPIFEFLKTAVFSMRLFFLICFHRSPSIFTRNETFCEHKALLKAFGTMRLAGDLHQKNFPQFSVFLKVYG